MIKMGQSFRYSLVAGTCLLLSMTLIPLFAAAGLHYSFGTILAFAIVAVVGFCMHCHWTFAVDRSVGSFLRYVSTMAVNVPLTIALIAIGHDIAGLSIVLSTAIASVTLLLWNYFAVRWAIVRQPSRNAG